MMKRINAMLLTAALFLTTMVGAQTYTYETVPNDPMNVRIYTLDNGLKVYMSVYKDAPRIQTYVSVRAGSKHDPAETTGLAHYFEHMMFKGTSNFGTMDFAREKPLVDTIEALFEQYRRIPMEDETARRDLYRVIDSISYEASKLAIPNEYDKLMSIIGSTGTNAFTSLEQTTYIESIPSNQLDNWALIQADRFTNPVLRLFHTELETIYEEKNMTLTSDQRKIFTALLEGLFSNHTYGTQTTIGTQDHIKNPSMTNIRWFFNTYYVPNNMAVILAGDFNPDEAIVVVDRYFGGMKPGQLPKFSFKPEAPITEPVVKEVQGPDAESLMMAFRFEGANSRDAIMISMIDMILSNSAAGLIDLNLNQKQRVMQAGSNPMIMEDYSVLMLSGKPKTGQTLEQVRDLLLEQIEIIKKGEFEDWLVPAIINDLKLKEIKKTESNNARGMSILNSFVLGVPWSHSVSFVNELENITKNEIVAYANEHFKNNYVIVYKRTGKDESIKRIKKNKLTPIALNREAQSDFLKKMEGRKVADIEPVFVEYEKDIQKLYLNNKVELLYKKNEETPTFSLYYVLEMGSDHNPKLGIAIDYLEYLGTSKYTPEQMKIEFYKLGTSFSVFNSNDRIYVMLRGLSENMEKAVALFESLLADAQPNAEALENLKSDILKGREDSKKNVQAIFGNLVAFGMYGPKNSATNIIPEKQLKAMQPDELIQLIRSLTSYEHTVLYYGSHESDHLISMLNTHHRTPATLAKIPAQTKFKEKATDKNQVYVVDFDTRQAQILLLTRSEQYNVSNVPIARMFNEYFGGSMNSVVFQELREARALAYTAMSFYQIPSELDKHSWSISYIATQYDKMQDAIGGLNDLMNNMPLSDKSFGIARNSIVSAIRTERITKNSVLMSYLSNRKLGLKHDIRRDVFEKVPTYSLQDVQKFQEQYIKGKNQTILILGDKKEIDFKLLKKYGKVKVLKLTDIFGY
jgi:predicted Zn-dependent peptidase